VYVPQGEFVRFHEVLQRMQDFIFEALYNRHALEHRLRILQVGEIKSKVSSVYQNPNFCITQTPSIELCP
jgi:hypothetical protein